MDNYIETGNIDEEKQSKNTTQYVLDTTIHKQTQLILHLLGLILEQLSSFYRTIRQQRRF